MHSFSFTAARSAWLSKFNDRPLYGLGTKLVSRDVKQEKPSRHCLSLIVPSPKSSLRSGNDCELNRLKTKKNFVFLILNRFVHVFRSSYH